MAATLDLLHAKRFLPIQSSFTQRYPQLAGALAVTVSTICFTLANLATSTVARAGMPTVTVLFYIGVVRFVFGGLLVISRRDWREAALCRGQSWSFVKLVGARQLVGCLSSVLIVATLSMLSIGEATSLIQTAPIWAVLLGCLRLGEPLTFADVLAAVGACVGVALIALPTQDHGEAAHAELRALAMRARVLGVACGLASGITVAFLYVAIRAIGERQVLKWRAASVFFVFAPLRALSHAASSYTAHHLVDTTCRTLSLAPRSTAACL